MYINTVFIMYIIAILISLVCLMFIALIFVRKNDRGNETYISARRFAINVMLTGLLYFVFYYREVVQREFELKLPFRIVDYTLCILQFFMWFMLLGNMLNKERHKNMFAAVVILTACRLAASLVVTVGFMGDYYNIDNEQVRNIWMAVEVVFIILTAVMLLYYGIFGIMECVSSFRRKYIGACTLLLVTWGVAQGVIDTGLFAGKFGVSAWALQTPDFTGLTMFLLNLATCIFVFREDFSPLFFSPHPEEKSVTDMSDRLNAIASDHKLTVREREVMELLYKGYTNPDIAEALYISVNTVKKHVRNIFDKMDAGNRMEVVHIINAWSEKK